MFVRLSWCCCYCWVYTGDNENTWSTCTQLAAKVCKHTTIMLLFQLPLCLALYPSCGPAHRSRGKAIAITLTIVLHMHMSKCTSNMVSVSMSLTQCSNKSCSPLLWKYACRSAVSAQKSCDVFATVLYNVVLNHALQFYAHVSTSVLGQKILLTNFVPLMTIIESWSLPSLVPDDCKLYTSHHQEDQNCCNCNSCHCQSRWTLSRYFRCALSGYFWWNVWSV